MLAGFRADAARDRDELRIDLRARAEHAEHQADAYRDELTQLRAETSHDTDTTTQQDATAHQAGHPAVTRLALAASATPRIRARQSAARYSLRFCAFRASRPTAARAAGGPP